MNGTLASTAGGGTSGLAHGGRLGEARKLFPGAPEPLLDLSTGINPVPYPLPPLDPACWTRLPEPEQEAALRIAAAAAYRVADPSLVAAAPGTQVLIDLLPRLIPARRVAVLGPTYAEHAHAWGKSGAEVRTVADPAELAGADVAVLCNPNNPDGRRFAAAEVLALGGRCGTLVVDEAFADLEPCLPGAQGEAGGAGPASLSVAPCLPQPRLIVLRSFGKTYGLAGLRLGFALAEAGLAARLRDALGPWAVSGPAIAIGCAALGDPAWRAEAAARLVRDCAELDALLAAAGMRVVGGTRLFRLAESPEAGGWFHRLGQAGILLRRFAERPDWLRFGLPGTPVAWGRLRRALRQAQAGAD